jgi:hypothetical protein
MSDYFLSKAKKDRYLSAEAMNRFMQLPDEVKWEFVLSQLEDMAYKCMIYDGFIEIMTKKRNI